MLVFIDLKKAFDSVWDDGLLNKLQQIDVGGSFYNFIKSLYHNSSCSIKIAQKRDHSVVREVCGKAVSFALENTLSDPFVLPNGAKLNSLLYADYLIILSRSKTGLQNCLYNHFLHSVLHG